MTWLEFYHQRCVLEVLLIFTALRCGILILAIFLALLLDNVNFEIYLRINTLNSNTVTKGFLLLNEFSQLSQKTFSVGNDHLILDSSHKVCSQSPCHKLLS